MGDTEHNAPPQLRIGAAYYHEYGRGDRLDHDLDLMKQAGFTVIRVGESVWSTWEPQDGVFNLDWLEPVLDGAHARGIGVILGTPTYAVPPWLARKHPEIAGETATGVRMPWGMRQEADFTHPAFLHHAERIIHKIVDRYQEHPAIIGYQVDNEPGIRLLYNHSVFQRFLDHLRHTYGTVERLNEEWGLVYWSHRLSTWEDLWLPDGNTQPQYDLAWRRFQASLVTDYIAWQTDVVRSKLSSANKEMPITTCISYDQVGVEDEQLSRALTVAAGNAYYDMAETLAHPFTEPMSAGWIVRGPWAVYQLADLMYSSKQAPFLVTETNAGSIGFGSINSVAFDGQWRQVAWALMSRGATMIEYWHWHTLHYGTETFWGGVLPHDGIPGRAYNNIAELGQEIQKLSPHVGGATPDADVAFLYDSDAKWALSFPITAPLPSNGVQGMGDTDSYRRIALPFYRGAFDAGVQINTVRPHQLFGALSEDHCATTPDSLRDAAHHDATHHDAAASGEDPVEFARRRPVLIAVALYTATDAHLQWLTQYVEAGGHLIVGPRTAYADHEGRARHEVKPAFLARPAGVSYQESANLHQPVPVTSTQAEGFTLSGHSAAHEWIDFLRPEGATTLAEYNHPHFGQWSAVVTARHGAGRITTVGTVPDQQLAADLMRWAVPVPRTDGWVGSQASVRATSMTRPDGSGLVVVHNWADTPATVTAATPCVDLSDEAPYTTGDTIRLTPWDVRILHVTH